MMTHYYPTNIPFVFNQIRGKKGEKGDKGDRGKRGRNGKRGKQGIQGKSIVGPQGIQGPPGVVDQDFSQYLVKILSVKREEVGETEIEYSWAQTMCTNDCKTVENIKVRSTEKGVLLYLCVRKSIETTFIVVDQLDLPYVEIISGYGRNEIEVELNEICKGIVFHITTRFT